jgi:hypothetical protein
MAGEELLVQGASGVKCEGPLLGLDGPLNLGTSPPSSSTRAIRPGTPTMSEAWHRAAGPTALPADRPERGGRHRVTSRQWAETEKNEPKTDSGPAACGPPGRRPAVRRPALTRADPRHRGPSAEAIRRRTAAGPIAPPRGSARILSKTLPIGTHFLDIRGTIPRHRASDAGQPRILPRRLRAAVGLGELPSRRSISHGRIF